jgi:hypothetical protein
MSTPRSAERYGRRARAMPSRRVLAVLAALAVLSGLGLAYLGYRNLGDPAIEGHVLDWRPVGDGELTVRFAVRRDHPERPATCVLRARAQDGAEVGRIAVPVPAGMADVARTAELPVSRTAVVAEVYSCEYNG